MERGVQPMGEYLRDDHIEKCVVGISEKVSELKDLRDDMSKVAGSVETLGMANDETVIKMIREASRTLRLFLDDVGRDDETGSTVSEDIEKDEGVVTQEDVVKTDDNDDDVMSHHSGDVDGFGPGVEQPPSIGDLSSLPSAEFLKLPDTFTRPLDLSVLPGADFLKPPDAFTRPSDLNVLGPPIKPIRAKKEPSDDGATRYN